MYVRPKLTFVSFFLCFFLNLSLMPILLHRWEIASPSSCPAVCLERAAPSFFTTPLSPGVPAAESLCHHGQESNAMPPALLLGPIHFSAISEVQGMASCVGPTWHGSSLEGGNDGDIHGRVSNW